jgi:hypothetical protein
VSAREEATAAPAGRAVTLKVLSNVVREPLRTCRVCATPVDGFDLCWRCREHLRVGGVADLAAPLMYAIDTSESAALLREYKNHPVRSVRQRRCSMIGELLWLAISLHQHCFGAAVGSLSRCEW